jgi:hypothetical protein
MPHFGGHVILGISVYEERIIRETVAGHKTAALPLAGLIAAIGAHGAY